jgi:putative thiamine transport system substrate-binding protein
MNVSRRHLGLLAAAFASPARADASDWPAVEARARGQSVAFNAWAGDEKTNAFIAWASERLRASHAIELRHVRLRDTSEAVTRVVAERSAGRDTNGAVDLIWLNGPNFLALKQQGFLLRFADTLPNFALVDTVGKPATVVDFTVPVDGLAAPWRMAQIVFIHDTARVSLPPRSMQAMLGFAASHRGRLAHPTARNFLGATFLKQALFELTPDRSVLQSPVEEAGFAAATAPLWAWYDALRPNLWRQGRQFPENGPATRNLLADGEIDLMVSFNPSEAALAISSGLLPPSVRSYVLDGGTIGNASFVAIPTNAAQPDAARVVANFLLSPEAQARAQNPDILGATTVLALQKLTVADRRRFEDLPRGPGMLTNAELGQSLPEPHPSWMTRIVAEWDRRTSAV